MKRGEKKVIKQVVPIFSLGEHRKTNKQTKTKKQKKKNQETKYKLNQKGFSSQMYDQQGLHGQSDQGK